MIGSWRSNGHFFGDDKRRGAFCGAPFVIPLPRRRRSSIVSVMMRSEEKYLWTGHSRFKMRQYRLTESRVKRIIRHPVRVEKGILEGAVACMQPAAGGRYSEIWTMYTPIGGRRNPKSPACQSAGRQIPNSKQRKIKIITAWRYPGRSPARDPVPAEILKEIRRLV